jgi:thioesterase domain-containing protein/acyl carrier protein
MQVETFPLTPNGKIDYEALPMPVVKAGEDYVAPGNEWEENLVEIWSDVLQRDKDTIGINDNFFELGGHSLKATAVAAKLQKELDVGIPLVEIFNKPTIKELAEYIMEAGTRGIEPGDNNLMLLRRGESPGANHIFFVHDGTGDVEGYIEFCNRLKNGFNLWGIRANRSDYYFPWDVTIEDISGYYVKKVKSLQSQGPYYIAGWSLGGTIAFEMVRQLEQGGDEVRFLAMIDVIAPGSKKLGKGSKFTLESEVNWVLDSFTDNEMKEKLKSANHLTQLWSMIGDYLVENNIDTEQLKKIIPENLAKAIPDFEQLRIKELINYFNVYRTLVNARAIYRPNEKINTMIHYFVASRSKKILKPSWNNYSVNPMKLYEIDGDHFSIFKMPHVETLAKIFDTILDSPQHI